MDLLLAFLAGALGGIIAVGIAVAVGLRKLKNSPQYQQIKAMNQMLGSMGGPGGGLEEQIMGMGGPNGPKGRGFKKYS